MRRKFLRPRLAAVAVRLAVLLAAGAAGTVILAGVLAPDEAVEQGSSGNYLPLAVGSRWELTSRSAADPMVLDVTGRDGDAFVVEWENPFVEATFRFEVDGTRVLLVGLDMGQGNAQIPADTVYWDFGPRKGQRWKSSVGESEVSDRGVTVKTPSGEYTDTVEVRTIDQQGGSMYWTFARDVGLVRWGRGRDAFLLSSVRHGGPSTRAPEPARPAAPPARPRAVPRTDPGGRVLIGLDATPHEKSGGGKRGKLAALRQAYDAGMTLLHSAPKWNDFEKRQGRVDLDNDADAIGEFAEEFDLPIALNIRIVDTNQRSMPKPYERWSFDDERLAERLRAAMRAFPQAYKRRTRYLAIGNEIDGYFSSRRKEIGPYAVLLRRVLDTARQEFPNAQFTVNFTFGAVTNMDRYRAITDLTDIASFTYYPLTADFSMRAPSELRRDIRRMLDASDGKRLYIQEIGYASAERLNSSREKQAEFYANAFAAFREHEDRVIGATFLFMSDFSQAVVDSLARYYTLPNSANFKAYLQTLGLLERNGTPKPAWDVFRREALAMKGKR